MSPSMKHPPESSFSKIQSQTLLQFKRLIRSKRTTPWKERAFLAKLLRERPARTSGEGLSRSDELQVCEARYRSLFENSLDAIFSINCEGRFVSANPAATALCGYSLEEMRSMEFCQLCAPEHLETTVASFKASLLEQQPGIETAFFTKGGERIDVYVTGLRIENAEGVVGLFCVARDTTLQKRVEFKRNLSLEFMGLFNSSNSTAALLQKSAELFQLRSGCDAVGIRIREGNGYPYFEARNFSPEFLAQEDCLCCFDSQGCIQRDGKGDAILGGLCGRVLYDQPNHDWGFTENGSFCSGDLYQFVEERSQKPFICVRGKCLGEEFRSLALIPLGRKGNRLGLLQFGSKRRNHFSPEMLCFWEQMADELSIAFAKFQTEDALKKANEQLELRVQERTAELQIANQALTESEERFRQMAESVGEVFWLAGTKLNKIYYASPAYEKVWGQSLKELESNPHAWLDAVHPEDREAAAQAFLSIAELGAPVATEYRIIHADGSVLWIADQGFPVRDEKGQIYRIAGVARDVTSSKRAESELRRAHNALWILKGCDEALARASSETELLDRICQIILGIDGMKMAWVGYAEHDGLQTIRPVAQAGDTNGYLQEEKYSWAAETANGLEQDAVGKAIRTQRVVICRDLLGDNGMESWRRVRIRHGFSSKVCLPLVWGGTCIGVLAIYSAVSDAFNEQEIDLLTRLAADLTHGIHSLRARIERAELQEELLRISDREKQSIAQEIHDGLCQHLVATAMLGSMLHRKLEARHDPDAEEAKQISEFLNMGAKEARNLAHGLHPVRPEAEGLMMALSGLAQMVSKLFQVTCTFNCDQPVAIENQSIASHLFRMAQEAANNAMKHGRATEVLISLTEHDQAIHLTIRDNGTGIPLQQSFSGGMGLKIMRYRATAIGASLEIGRAGVTGTIVSCSVPFSRLALSKIENS